MKTKYTDWKLRRPTTEQMATMRGLNILPTDWSLSVAGVVKAFTERNSYLIGRNGGIDLCFVRGRPDPTPKRPLAANYKGGARDPKYIKAMTLYFDWLDAQPVEDDQ
jgi:hypothetical protein